MSLLLTTGERTVPGAPHEQYWFARHEVVYRWLAERVGAGELWVDAGSGEGYGTALLAAAGARAIGIELDATATSHASARYADAAFTRANLARLPVRSGSVDAVVSLQVVEHLWDVPRFLGELARVCRPGATIYLSTPNRSVFSPGLGRGVRPTNPFHVEEFDAAQVADMLLAIATIDVHVLGVHHGARIAQWEAQHGSLMAAQVDAMVADHWSADLDEVVASVTSADFSITPVTGGAQDLLAIGRVQ